MWFGKLGGSSVEVCYEVHNDPTAEPRQIYARSTAIIVLVDAQTGRPHPTHSGDARRLGAVCGRLDRVLPPLTSRRVPV